MEFYWQMLTILQIIITTTMVLVAIAFTGRFREFLWRFAIHLRLYDIPARKQGEIPNLKQITFRCRRRTVRI